MTDAAVVRRQDDAHPVLLGDVLGKAERRCDLRQQLVRQPDIGLRIGNLRHGNVELACHRRHDLHQSAGPAARDDVGSEARFVVGDGAHQPPVVALLFADMADHIVVSRDDVAALGEQRTVHRLHSVRRAVRRGCGEPGVEAVESGQNGQERKR